MKRRKGWSLLSTHGLVLVYLGQHPDVTVRAISEALELSPRQIFLILREIEQAGMIARTRVGRANRYRVDLAAPLNHPFLASLTVGELLGQFFNRPTPSRRMAP